MKSNLNTELLEYLQQAGKEITKGYIQKTGNKHCKFDVIQFSDIAKPEPDGKPDIIRKTAELYDQYKGNEEYIHIPDVPQMSSNFQNFPVIGVINDEINELEGVMTIKFNDNREEQAHPENNLELNVVIDCTNLPSLYALSNAVSNINSRGLVGEGKKLDSNLEAIYAVKDENGHLIEAPTYVLKVGLNAKEKEDKKLRVCKENETVISFNVNTIAEKHKKNLDNKFKNISIEVKKLKNEENKKSNNNGESLIQETENNIKKREFSDNMINSYLDEKQSKKFLQGISTFPHGVLNKNERGDVTTSINLGVVNLKENEIKVGMRSSRKEEENNCLKKLKEYCNNNSFEFIILSSQPSFRTNEDDEIVRKLIKAHPTKLFKEKPSIKSMHITVEVGIFQRKIPNIQIAIISPNIQGAHTTKECVEVTSIEKTNKWIENFLKSFT